MTAFHGPIADYLTLIASHFAAVIVGMFLGGAVLWASLAFWTAKARWLLSEYDRLREENRQLRDQRAEADAITRSMNARIKAATTHYLHGMPE